MVLDVACGTGEPGLTIASLANNGKVIKAATNLTINPDALASLAFLTCSSVKLVSFID